MAFLLNELKKGGRRLAATLVAGLATFGAVSPAFAGSFQVNPVNIELPADRSSTSLTIRNNDSDPVSIRVVTMDWTQENGEDVYTQTKDVIVSPPIFTMAGGATQLVRVGLRDRTPGAAYRVILEEIPSEKLEGTRIQVALRLNLPLYVLHKNDEAKVSWTANRNAEGELVIEGHNDGTRHAQVLELSTFDAQGDEITLSKKMEVVLPGSSIQWNVGRRDIALPSSLPITVRTQQGEVRTSAVVEKR